MDKSNDLFQSGKNAANAWVNGGNEDLQVQLHVEKYQHEMSSYMQKVHSDESFKLAYKLNTIGQNFLFNYIW